MALPRLLKIFWKIVAWTLLMLVAFTLPGSAFKTVKTFQHTDLVVHAVLYFTHTTLLIQAINRYNLEFDKSIKRAVCFYIPVAMGIAVEFVQGAFISNRHWDMLDIAANMLGTALALLIIPRLLNKKTVFV